MKIDGHAHACGVYLTSESIEKYLSEHKIDKVILSGGEPGSSKSYAYPMLSRLFKGEKLSYFFNKIICRVTKLNHVAEHIDEQNKIVADLAERMPEYVINTYWVNPLQSDCLEKMISNYHKYNFKMIKMHQCWTDFDIDNENCSRIFKWAAEEKLPVFIHLKSYEQVVKFTEAVNKNKDAVFIDAHMIGADYIAEMVKHKNVYFDLSAPQLYSVDILKRAVNNFGADRLLLGSDSPYGIDNLEKVLERLKRLNLSNNEIELISSANIMKLLSLTK